MRRNSRTPVRPLFTTDRPLGANWDWTVTLQIASSGYVRRAHVMAHRDDGQDHLDGIAHCEVSMYDDVTEVIECLAIEAMLAACEPTLTGETPTRKILYSSTL